MFTILRIGLIQAVFHIYGNADVTVKLLMINVNGDSKNSAPAFIDDTGILL